MTMLRQPRLEETSMSTPSGRIADAKQAILGARVDATNYVDAVNCVPIGPDWVSRDTFVPRA